MNTFSMYKIVFCTLKMFILYACVKRMCLGNSYTKNKCENINTTFSIKILRNVRMYIQKKYKHCNFKRKRL